MGLHSLRALLGALLALALLAAPAAARPADDGTQIATAFTKLTRKTTWHSCARCR